VGGWWRRSEGERKKINVKNEKKQEEGLICLFKNQGG
jgi:hypothetical protein